MPHQCVRCGIFYNDGAEEILKGCSCGAKLFFYVKKSKLKKAKKVAEELTDDQKKEIETQVHDIAGFSSEEPVVLDFEAVNVVESGKFEIDLVNVMNKEKPLVYKLEEGKYMIDVAESFKRNKEAKEEKN
jgi:predicted  nucleic acid-binding Zn-ribbon protein